LFFTFLTRRGATVIVLALAVLTVSTSAPMNEASPLVTPVRLAVVCTKSGERLGGLTKVCYYDCARWEGAMKAAAYDTCPAWTPRWRLNHNSQYGPIRKAR
jgi:hypothetical protein